MANPSGDGGRDSELFSPEGDPSVVFQYSVAKDWEAKIRRTAQRLAKYFADDPIKLLIFVSPQEIGAKADALKRELRTNFGFLLDIYDCNWFLERVNNTDAQLLAAEKLAEKVVDPIVRERSLSSITIPGIDSEELPMAHLFLSLQVRDQTQGRNLTKASFKAVVLSILRGTDSENKMAKTKIHETACALLPESVPGEVTAYIDRALERLSKNSVRHWTKTDEFCLSYEERQRVAEEIAAAESCRRRILSELQAQFLQSNISDQVTLRLAEHTLCILEEYLSRRSEAFCICIADGRPVDLSLNDLKIVITTRLSKKKELQDAESSVPNLFEKLGAAVDSILRSTDSKVRSYLRSRANAYIVLAFFKKTPNVKTLCKKIVGGNVWLDACILLPLLAEFLRDEGDRPYTCVLKNAVKIGMKLFVTSGVLEEVLAHIHRCIACSRLSLGTWQGDIPFLYAAYCESGESGVSFSDWAYIFRGDDDFQGNLTAFLDDEFPITLSQPPLNNYECFEFHARLHEYWCRLHEKRRARKGMELEPSIVQRMAGHDVENYLGVLSARKKETHSPLGYQSWWLTLDFAAYRAPGVLKDENPSWHHLSPAMGLDFLANYVSFSDAPHSSDVNIPVLPDLVYLPFATPDVLEEAAKIRNDLIGKPEQYIKRKVRDHIHSLRQKHGFHSHYVSEQMKETSEEDFSLED